MFKHTISQTLGIDVAVAATAAGTGDSINGNPIDTQGYESVAFAIQFGTITASAVTTIKLQAGNASDGSDAVDVPGASVSVPVSASGKIVWGPEIHRPTKRYVRPVVVRATANAVIAGGTALLGRAAVQPAPTSTNQGVIAAPVVLVSVP